METLLPYFGHWTWFIIGALLLIAELAVPGIVLVWFGLAAIGVGLIDLILPMSWQMELTLFSVLSVILLVVGRPFVTKRLEVETDQPNLNQRNHAYIGKTYKLHEPVRDGQSFLVINDTRWRVRGDNIKQGMTVRVTDVDGLELVVEPVTG